MTFPRKATRPRTLSDESSATLIEQFGKMPPQATDLEETVLGALMLDKDAMERIAEVLTPQAFYKESNQKIFEACRRLFERGQPIDIVTVTKEVRHANELDFVGGPFYITSLTNRVGSAAHIEHHARIISEKHIQRELIRVSTEIQREAYDESKDVFELLDFSEKSLFQIAESNIAKQTEKIDGLLVKAIRQIENVKDHKDGLSGIGSGFTGLDRITNGWQNNNLIIVAARPGMGKTAFALTCARNAAIYSEKAVAVFSLEMESVELVTRLISSEAMIDAQKLKSGKLEPHEWEQLNHKVKALSNAPIYIDDTAALSMFQLRAKCRRLKAQHNVGMVVVDYLQLMKGDDSSKASNREQEISYISRSLKALAKELGLPIMALAQLNREAEKRHVSAKSPQLSDLRESGSIEQDADIVMFINRPEKYGIHQDEAGNSLQGAADLIIAKHRNGPTDTVRVRFEGQYTRFTDWTPSNTYYDPQSSSGGEGEPEITVDNQVTITRRSKMDEFPDEEVPF